VHGDGADTPLVWYESTGTGLPQYLYTDHQGSIVARTDASGTVLNLNAYDEYGIPNAANTGRFQYTGCAHWRQVRFGLTVPPPTLVDPPFD
jgi:hypothetical protein